MLTPSIKIDRYPYEGPEVRLSIEASNGRQVGMLDIYTTPDALLELSEALQSFPRHASDVHDCEWGSEDAKHSAYYIRIRLFTIDRAGHCGIQIRMNNNREFPNQEMCDFSIFPDASELGRFGRLLREFSKLQHEVLRWDLSTGTLYRTRFEAAQDDHGGS